MVLLGAPSTGCSGSSVVAKTDAINVLLRKTGLYAWILRFGSWFLISVALYWAFERAFDVDIPIVSIVTTPFTWLFAS